KVRDKPLRVQSLVMSTYTNLSERILKAQLEAVKQENVKVENLGRLLKPIFEIHSNGIRIGHVAYRLELSKKLCGIINTFHVSNLKKYLADENLVIPLEEIQMDDKLHFIEALVENTDREVKDLSKAVSLLLTFIRTRGEVQNYTWEREYFFMRKHPHLFPSKKQGHGNNRAPRVALVDNLEYRQGVLTRKIEDVSNAEVADSIAIGRSTLEWLMWRSRYRAYRRLYMEPSCRTSSCGLEWLRWRVARVP
nr:hypothetical protein [Tanacetum cinerariifolium]